MGYYNGKKVLSVVRTEYLAPNGNIKLTQNGSYDVSAYKKAVVSVFPSGTTQKVDEENVGLTTSQLPATTLPKGLINYVGGMSQKVNQGIRNANFSSTSYWTAEDGDTLSVSNNIATITLNSVSSSTRLRQDLSSGVLTTEGHKYLVTAMVKVPSACSVSFNQAGAVFGTTSVTANTWTTISVITERKNQYGTFRLQFDTSGMSVGDTIEIEFVFIEDLTKTYPNDEPTTTSDSRVQWLIHYLTENPQYDEGSIVNAPVEKLSSKGFNIWDEEWENGYIGSNGVLYPSANYIRSKNFIRVLPNATYFCKVATQYTAMYFTEYDINGNFIKQTYRINATITTQPNTAKIRFFMGSEYGTTYNHDICINLSGSMNGTYKPYQAPSEFPIPAEVKALDGYGLGYSATLFNKTDLESKKFVKSFVELDLGDLNYSYSTSSRLFQVSLSQIKAGTSNLLCSKYTYGVLSGGGNDPDKTIYVYQKALFISDSAYTDATTFKNAVVGQKLVIELETPTETDISEYLDRDFPNVNLIDTYQGGEVEFENDNDMGVPYSLTYQYRVE